MISARTARSRSLIRQASRPSSINSARNIDSDGAGSAMNLDEAPCLTGSGLDTESTALVVLLVIPKQSPNTTPAYCHS